MGFFKRVWSYVDRAVAQLEDHDTLVESALRRLLAAETTAREELDRIHEGGEALGARLSEQQANAKASRRRAATNPSDAEAIELLRLARRADRHGAHLEEELREHGAAEARLTQHADTLSERIETLRRQHHVMRARRAQADAAPDLTSAERPVEELLERWDEVLTKTEKQSDPWSEIEREDEERTLRRELRELRMKEAG